MAVFTPTQGRYLAFIHAYIELHGIPPAESDIAAAMCVSPPSVNPMVKMLEKKGLILRHPGHPSTREEIRKRCHRPFDGGGPSARERLGHPASIHEVGVTRRLLNFLSPASGAGKPSSGGFSSRNWMAINRNEPAPPPGPALTFPFLP